MASSGEESDSLTSEINSYSSSEDSSEQLYHSFSDSSGDFLPYDENLEPIATEQEAAEYEEQVALEEEEDQVLLSRFSGEVDVEDWCKCSNCSLEFVVESEECRCCMEVERCRETMEALAVDQATSTSCVRDHPGFNDVCLNRWVLEIAGIGLKTRVKKSYSTTRTQMGAAEPEFLRSVAYRQFVRLVWEYVGSSRRLPLPNCIYNSIRAAFPNNMELYQGYEEED